MIRKLLAGFGAVALVAAYVAPAAADCSAGHTAQSSTPVKTAQISTPDPAPAPQPTE